MGKCNGCGAWKRICPADAISGEKKIIHTIMAAACIIQGKIIKKEVVSPEERIDPKPFLDEAYKRIREISFLEIREDIIVSQTL